MKVRRRGETINIVAALLVVGVGLVTGLAVFTVMRSNADVALQRNLVSGLALRVQWVVRDIRDARVRVRMVATRPFLADKLAAPPRRAGAALTAVDRGLRAFLVMRLSALALYRDNGTLYAHVGTFMAHPVVDMPLRGKLGATLLWNEGIRQTAGGHPLGPADGARSITCPPHAACRAHAIRAARHERSKAAPLFAAHG